jgi:demethylmenaquinone methyltransferase/2-methoxy-6-polyprenyl-1,4-benzoquinol methylase
MSLPAADEKARHVRAMFDAIAPRYDLLNRILTLGMDMAWRRRAVRQLQLPEESVVADLACGTGDLCRQLADAGHRPVGVDVSWGMLRHARTDAPLVHADILALPVAAASLDGATCGFALRNVVSLPPMFRELGRAVRPGGRIALLEVDQPRGRVLRWGHGLYFGRVVPFVGGLLSDRDAYRYLPDSVAYLPSPAHLADELAAAGFVAIERTRLAGGIAQLIVATRAPERGPSK